MRIAALLVALFTIAVGVVGLIFPDSGMTLRGYYYATPGRFYPAASVRVAMGLVLILAASSSSWPKALRAFGAVMCLQGIVATLSGLERARAIMEWEGTQGALLLRAGAGVALASGAFLAFAVTQRPSKEKNRG